MSLRRKECCEREYPQHKSSLQSGKDTQKRAWQYLQNMDKQHSNPTAMWLSRSLVGLLDRYYRSQDDPYFENQGTWGTICESDYFRIESAMEKHFRYFFCRLWRECRKAGWMFRSHSRNWMRKWIGIFLENKFAPSWISQKEVNTWHNS